MLDLQHQQNLGKLCCKQEESQAGLRHAIMVHQQQLKALFSVVQQRLRVMKDQLAGAKKVAHEVYF